MKNNVIIIIPYFGKFPDIFSDFLNSCGYNPDINWLIFTDNEICFDYPKNVSFINMTFEEMKRLIQSRFDFQIEIIRPHKLCDFKPLYGFIYQDYIKDYKYWGHGDLDVIYGNLLKFLNPHFESNYDKIYGLGHFAVYKNCEPVNHAFLLEYNSKEIYKEVLSTDKAFAYDEWHCPIGSINHQLINAGFKVFVFSECANLDSEYNGFKLSDYVYNYDNYLVDDNSVGIFEFDNGSLFRHYISHGNLQKKEYLYIHFHKRKITRKSKDSKNFIIKPNEIIDKLNISESQIRLLSRVSLINKQYLKVRLINLKYRMNILFRSRK